MVFSEYKNDKMVMATIVNGNLTEQYDCSFWACENPQCTCGSLTLEFVPANDEDFSSPQSISHTVDIDVAERKLAFKDKKKVPKATRVFSRLFLSQLEEEDFLFLFKQHFAFKNKITENTEIRDIDALFDYYKVEQDGLMYAYNDILPYGDQIQFKLTTKDCIVFDQYCLLPHCPCTDANLTVTTCDNDDPVDELCTFEVNYKKKRWKILEEFSPNVSIKAVKSAMEDQIPDIYNKLLKRHRKIKSIYANCKLKHFQNETPMKREKIGRNDPCPCGSGKKYKKCCLGKL